MRTSLRTAFYTGGGSTALVPDKWDCALNGRAYMLDWKFAGTAQMARSSIKLLRPQQESGTISETSLNPAEGIRAKLESWHHGAGQMSLDRDGSNPFRFRSSKGVDPWTRWKLSLLRAVGSRRASLETNLAVESVGSFLYVADGNEVFHTTSVAGAPTWTSAAIFAGEVAQSVKSITTDGFYLYAALGSSGIHRTVRGAASTLHYSDLSTTLIGYVKGRLMAANGNSIYNVIASGVAPSALYTHPNTDFTWVGFAEGQGHIYAAGFSGDKSLVYRTAVKSDGTALDVPVVAGSLPDGEIIRSIEAYLGLLLVGTDSGVWVAESDAAGNLTLNKVVDTTLPVRCFEGQGTYVWFGWTNYDATSTGLGRMDLTVDVGGRSVVTPAHASDILAAGQGNVTDVATFGNLRVFAVAGLGLFAETSSFVTEGTIDSGTITYGFPDDKVALNEFLSFEPLTGSITVRLSAEGGSFLSLGTASTAGTTSARFSAGEATGDFFELRHVLNGDGTNAPTLTRSTLEANPSPGRGETFTVALLFHEQLEVNGNDERFDCALEYRNILDLETSGKPVVFQDCLGSETVIVDDHDFLIESMTPDRRAYEGTMLASLRRPRRSN